MIIDNNNEITCRHSAHAPGGESATAAARRRRRAGERGAAGAAVDGGYGQRRVTGLRNAQVT